MSEFDRPELPDLPPTLDEAHQKSLLNDLTTAHATTTGLDRLRELPTPTRIGIAVVVLAVMLAGSDMFQGLRPDLAEALPNLGPKLAVVVISGLFALIFAFRPIYRPTPRPSQRTMLALAGVFLITIAAVSPGLWPGIYLPDDIRGVVDRGCATGATVTGVLVSTTFFLLDRHRGKRVFSSLAILSAGASLAFVVQTLACPAIDIPHLLGPHALAGSLGGLLALTWSRRRRQAR